MAMATSSAGVSLRLEESLDEDGEYNAFTNAQVDIIKNETKIGSTEATLVDRRRIPACDEHSGDLQRMDCTIYEPRYGRTKLNLWQSMMIWSLIFCI